MLQVSNIYDDFEFPVFKKESRETKIKKIQSMYPDLKEKLELCCMKIENNPYLLPYDLHEELVKTYMKTLHIYQCYIEGQAGSYGLEALQGLLDKLDCLYSDIEKFNTENKDTKFICSLELKKWIEHQHKNSTLLKRIQKEDAVITNNTLSYIYAPEFFHQFENELLGSINDRQLSFVKLDGDTLLFTFQYDEAYTFDLRCSLKKFMAHAYIEESILKVDAGKLKNSLSFVHSLEQKYKIIKFLQSVLSGSGYNIVFIPSPKSKDVFYKKGEDWYTKADYKYLQDFLLAHLKQEKDFIKEKLIVKMIAAKHWKQIPNNSSINEI